MDNDSFISIVIPAYNEAETLPKTAATINNIMTEANISHEVIFVDDGSTDDTWRKITEIANEYQGIVGVRLSKNFGKEGAILAGLQHAAGQACALIDCDLQHPPHVLVEMYNIWKQGGIDVVDGIKESRGKESVIYKNFQALFYFLIEKTGGIKLKNLSDFQLLDRRVVDILVNLPEKQRFFRALSAWVGFNRAQVKFAVEPRAAGASKFNFRKSMKYAIVNITSFSSVPMQAVTVIGIIFFIASVILGIHTFVTWMQHRAVEGFTTVILLLLIIGSVLMFSLGVVGIYISKIYEEIKNRPIYLIDSVVKSSTEKID